MSDDFFIAGQVTGMLSSRTSQAGVVTKNTVMRSTQGVALEDPFAGKPGADFARSRIPESGMVTARSIL